MKKLSFLIMLLVSSVGLAEDKNTSQEYPTAEYKLPNGEKVIEFTPKGNKDVRCLYIRSVNPISGGGVGVGLSCYPTGDE